MEGHRGRPHANMRSPGHVTWADRKLMKNSIGLLECVTEVRSMTCFRESLTRVRRSWKTCWSSAFCHTVCFQSVFQGRTVTLLRVKRCHNNLCFLLDFIFFQSVCTEINILLIYTVYLFIYYNNLYLFFPLFSAVIGFIVIISLSLLFIYC